MAVYIDRESTIQAIREIPRGNWSRNRFIAEVMSIPEADVSPVVHGKWIYEESNGVNSFKGSYWCNQCHRPVTFRENYCPECGAKMDL